MHVEILLNLINQTNNIGSSRPRRFSKILNFVGNNAKTLTVFTGLRRNNRGIKRQEVRLVGNTFNDRNNIADLRGRIVQTIDNIEGRLRRALDLVDTMEGCL